MKNTTMIGSWLNTGSTIVAELMAGSGLDFVTIDMEHSPVGIDRMAELLRAIRSGSPKCKALVRTPGQAYHDIKRYMDAGAYGVIVPFVNDASTANAIVDSVKYPPLGRRGVGFARDNDYGINLINKLKHGNDKSFVCVQIEDISGMHNLDEILGISGIDAAFLGPYDLSASMGIAGDFEHPEYKNTCSKFLSACQSHDVMAGIHVVQPNPDEALKRIKEGYNMIAYSLDITLLGSSLSEGLKQINGRI
jgi:2-dehydro-3-deoxyglucarate aldolase